MFNELGWTQMVLSETHRGKPKMVLVQAWQIQQYKHSQIIDIHYIKPMKISKNDM